jgi:hypothetical protein
MVHGWLTIWRIPKKSPIYQFQIFVTGISLKPSTKVFWTTYDEIKRCHFWRATPHNSAGALPSQTHFHPNVRILVLSFYYLYVCNISIRTSVFRSLSNSNVRIRDFLNSYVHIRGSFHFKRTYSRSFLFIRTYSRTESRASSYSVCKLLDSHKNFVYVFEIFAYSLPRFSFKSRWVSICRGLSFSWKQSKILRWTCSVFIFLLCLFLFFSFFLFFFFFFFFGFFLCGA